MRRRPLSSMANGSHGCSGTRRCPHEQYMAAAAWVDTKNATVAYLDLDYLSPGAIYALASGKFSAEMVEQVLTAAAARQRHIGEADVREIAKAGAKAAILALISGIDYC